MMSPFFLNMNMIGLPAAIITAFTQKLDEYGIEVENITQNKKIKAILSSYNLDSEFDYDDQNLTQELVGVVLKENAPKTGDILHIEDKKFIVKGSETRPHSPLFRFTAKEK